MRTFYKRQFLNSEEVGGIAFIEASIDDNYEGSTTTTHFDAEFSVADCSRIATLSFGVWSKEDAVHVRTKIMKFRRAVLQFEAALLVKLNEMDKQ